MLSKVAKRVRRRSVQPTVQPEGEPWVEVRGEIVQDAPELVRWANILDIAFPRVAMGGYARYYASTSSLKFSPSPPFCPVLSQVPQPSPSAQVPSTSPLFSSSPAKQQRLAVIHEVSTESIAITHPRPLISICTSPTDSGGGAGPKSSLRRKRRQLLRTPSIERDFAVHSRHLFSPCSNGSDNENDNETSSLDVPVSHAGGGSTHSHSYSTNSTNSHSSQSVGNNSEYLLTPSTSVEGAEDGDVCRVAKRLEEEEKEKLRKKEDDGGLETWMSTLKYLELPSRRESGTSFSTARSDFDDAPGVIPLPEDGVGVDVAVGLSPLPDRH